MTDDKSPVEGLLKVTKSDTARITVNGENYIGIGLYLDTAGTVRFVDSLGNEHTLAGLTAGILHPFKVRQVFNTTTTVTNVYVGTRI